jgi:chitin synthase
MCVSTDKQKQFVVTLPDEERVGWVWCLFFAFAVPEVMAFLRSIRICFFKNAPKPTVLEFSAVAVAETLRAVGTGLLIFMVLPNIDVVKGAMLTNCLCFVPGLLGKIYHQDILLDEACKASDH